MIRLDDLESMLPAPLRRTLDYLGRRGWLPIVALLLATLGLWGFLNIADEVQDQDAQPFDEQVLQIIGGRYDTASGFWREAGRDITALGGSTVITLVISGTVIFLLLGSRWKTSLFVIASVVGGLLISLWLKEIYDRPRPELFKHKSYTHTPSFPSGHSTNSAVAYLTIAILLAKLVDRPLLKGYIFFVGLLVPVLVGLSRLYLGVHWPTDVAAGWLLGLSWGLVVWGTATFLQRRNMIEAQGSLQPDRKQFEAEIRRSEPLPSR
jgi:undecaprenyl-diphosphatase